MYHNLPTSQLIALLKKRLPEDFTQNRDDYEDLVRAVEIECMDAWYSRKEREHAFRG